MKKLFQIICLAWCFIGPAILMAQDTLKVVNWNIEYFGNNTQYPPRQVDKVIAIMRQLNADVYGLCEIVSIDSLRRVVNSLDGGYDFVVSSYGSLAPDASSSYYSSAQKLALVYRKNKVRVLYSRPFMATSNNAFYNWASGRYPFLVATEILVGQSWQRLDFQVVHAKAMSDNQSCNRRTHGAHEWKDSLDVYDPNVPFMLLGDFNDDFDFSICGGNSNYQNIISDSTDNISYFAPTLQLSEQGYNTVYGYNSFIDHVVICNQLKPWYITNSTKVLDTEVNNWVSNYTADVSDHYPVINSYVPKVLPVTLQNINTTAVSIYPNPAQNYIHVHAPNGGWNQIQLINNLGVIIYQTTFKASATLPCQHLLPGIYLLKISDAHFNSKVSTINIFH